MHARTSRLLNSQSCALPPHWHQTVRHKMRLVQRERILRILPAHTSIARTGKHNVPESRFSVIESPHLHLRMRAICWWTSLMGYASSIGVTQLITGQPLPCTLHASLREDAVRGERECGSIE
jgi:hypothetical protein